MTNSLVWSNFWEACKSLAVEIWAHRIIEAYDGYCMIVEMQ